MTDEHAQALELAATAIDFELSAAEQASLDAHLEGCLRCRRRLIGLQADQRSLEGLPRYTPTQAVSDHVLTTIRRGDRSSGPTLRLLIAASLVALLALSSIVVGAGFLRQDQPPDLSVVPTPSPAATPDPLQSPVPSASPPPSQPAPSEPSSPPGNGLAAGTIVEVVTTGLRVRTNPTVDDATSAKLEPLLGPGARLRIVEGPVNADDYDWYRIEAIDLPHVGWVAAADHDGEAWIEDESRPSTPPSSLSAVEVELVAALRTDVAADCEPRRADLPTGADAGVECHLAAGVATRVGAYIFPDAAGATLTYLTRLAEYGVAPSSGDCAAGLVGDAVWTSEGGTTGRLGCFVNENDIANVRLTCDRLYLGVLGRADDLAALYQWAGGPAAGEQLTTAPDLCGALD